MDRVNARGSLADDLFRSRLRYEKYAGAKVRELRMVCGEHFGENRKTTEIVALGLLVATHQQPQVGEIVEASCDLRVLTSEARFADLESSTVETGSW